MNKVNYIKNLTIIVTAMNESKSLEKTIIGIIGLDLKIDLEIIISTSKKASSDCLLSAKLLADQYPKNVKVYFQKEPFVAAAIIEASKLAQHDYIVVMAADGETPFETIPAMIFAMNENTDIVCTSRWVLDKSFENYGKIKLLVNQLAQIVCKIFYPSVLTDYTFGFRLYRKQFLTGPNFQERKHPFFLESVLIPIKIGARCVEIPVNWKPRIEGSSIATKLDILQYLRPVLKNIFKS